MQGQSVEWLSGKTYHRYGLHCQVYSTFGEFEFLFTCMDRPNCTTKQVSKQLNLGFWSKGLLFPVILPPHAAPKKTITWTPINSAKSTALSTKKSWLHKCCQQTPRNDFSHQFRLKSSPFNGKLAMGQVHTRLTPELNEGKWETPPS